MNEHRLPVPAEAIRDRLPARDSNVLPDGWEIKHYNEQTGFICRKHSWSSWIDPRMFPVKVMQDIERKHGPAKHTLVKIEISTLQEKELIDDLSNLHVIPESQEVGWVVLPENTALYNS